MTPKRLQRKRTLGFHLPPNTVCVTRPGKFGNPFIVSPTVKPGSKSGVEYICVPTVEDAVECFRLMILERLQADPKCLDELRGKDLACFCRLDQVCHADVLLELANA